MNHILPASAGAVLLSVSIACAAGQSTSSELLYSCDARVAVASAKEILQDPQTLKEPFGMFDPAMVLFRHGLRDEAVFWFYAAQLRMGSQLVFERGDRGQLFGVAMMIMGPFINNHAFQDVDQLERTLQRVLAWDQETPNPWLRHAQKQQDIDQVERVYTSFGELRKKLRAGKVTLEAEARAAAPQMEQQIAMMGPTACSRR